MCFSAGASFTSGVVLTVIGVATVKKAQQPSEFFFACIPLIFGVQQFSEGILWLSLTYPSMLFLQFISSHVFIFFAQVVWPTWVPYALFRMEKNKTRKKTHAILVGCGVIVSAYLGYCLLVFPVAGYIDGRHISYKQDYPAAYRNPGAVLYLIATLLPCFFSTVKRMWVLAVAILVSYIITRLFYTEYTISVWCFFASIISIAVWLIMREIKIAQFPNLMRKA
ncbi:MAG TPA: DUF6629 family protein [Bacteroidia bacterium]|jgi:hypothetical protein|nr:DUF6629 family protein [Bacteroidia bacterium]